MGQPKDFGFGSEEQMVRDSARKLLKDAAGIEALRALVERDAAAAAGAFGRAALVEERRHRDRPALADLVDPVRVRDDDVLEQHLVEAGLAGDLDERAHRDALRVGDRDDEVREAVVLVGRRVPADHDHPAREVREARPHLVAVHDPVVALADARRLRVGEVAAGTRFGEALAPDLVRGEERWQEAPLLLGRAVMEDRRRGHREADHVQHERDLRAAELLCRDRLEARVPAAAGVLRVVAADKPGLVAALLPVTEVAPLLLRHHFDRALR